MKKPAVLHVGWRDMVRDSREVSEPRGPLSDGGGPLGTIERGLQSAQRLAVWLYTVYGNKLVSRRFGPKTKVAPGGATLESQ